MEQGEAIRLLVQKRVVLGLHWGYCVNRPCGPHDGLPSSRESSCVIEVCRAHLQIVQWLMPYVQEVRDWRVGWLIPIGLIFVLSFPPLFGNGTSALDHLGVVHLTRRNHHVASRRCMGTGVRSGDCASSLAHLEPALVAYPDDRSRRG
jgi:hypothetical protein